MAALSYVTTAQVKARLGIPNTTDDVVIGTLCDQVNGFIESYTHRAIGPWATGSTFTFHYQSDDSHDNGRIFDFSLSDEDMADLDRLDRTGGAGSAVEHRWW